MRQNEGEKMGGEGERRRGGREGEEMGIEQRT